MQEGLLERREHQTGRPSRKEPESINLEGLLEEPRKNIRLEGFVERSQGRASSSPRGWRSKGLNVRTEFFP